MRPKSGADGTRTRALRAASASLSQLSYGPSLSECNREVELVRPVDSQALIVSRGPQSQLDIRSSAEALEGQEETSIELGAIRRKRVDLVGGV